MTITIKPRLTPRNLSDALLSTAIGSIQIVVLFLLPAWLVYVWTGSMAVAGGVALASYGIFGLFSVTALQVDQTGIKLKRILGSPKSVPWSEVMQVREAPRWELIVNGWLWPLFPSRELTPSYTSIGHFRFQYGDQYFFYPPLDIDELINALPAHLKTHTTSR